MARPLDWTPLLPDALRQLRAMTSQTVYRGTLEEIFKIPHRHPADARIRRRKSRPHLSPRPPETDRTTGTARRARRTPPQPGAPAAEGSRGLLLSRRAHPERRRAAALPAAIQIRPGYFAVENAGLADLCAQLWVFLETCKDDPAGVEALLERTE